MISVLMANYNNAQYIDTAIKSVFNQTINDWELVVIDDCSTDGSLARIQDYVADPRVRIIKNEHNLGYTATLKRLIAEAKKDILGILDSDDALACDALEKIILAYQSDPKVGFVYSQLVFCNSNLVPLWLGNNRSVAAGDNLKSCRVSHFKTFRKSVYEKTSGYDESILYAEDKDLILKMEEVTEFKFIDEPLYFYRVLPNSQGNEELKRAIGQMSHSIARYKAYQRRGGTNISTISYAQMLKSIRNQNSLAQRLRNRWYTWKLPVFSLLRQFKPLEL